MFFFYFQICNAFVERFKIVGITLSPASRYIRRQLPAENACVCFLNVCILHSGIIIVVPYNCIIVYLGVVLMLFVQCLCPTGYCVTFMDVFLLVETYSIALSVM